MIARPFYVEISARADCTPVRDFEAFVEVLMDRLQDEPGATDADVGADLRAGRVDFCLHLEAVDAESALHAAKVVARSAAHAAGARTPGWEEIVRAVDDDDVLVSVRPAERAAS